jgi:hypothetical protein
MYPKVYERQNTPETLDQAIERTIQGIESTNKVIDSNEFDDGQIPNLLIGLYSDRANLVALRYAQVLIGAPNADIAIHPAVIEKALAYRRLMLDNVSLEENALDERDMSTLKTVARELENSYQSSLKGEEGEGVESATQKGRARVSGFVAYRIVKQERLNRR